MSVTVGIATRNRAGLLRQAISSVLAQDYPDVRLVVFDDASSDETPSLRAMLPEVEWVRVGQPQGYMAARNALMREAGTDYFLSLDDDAWFLQGDEIARAVEVLQRCPEAAAIAYDILSPDQPTSRPRGAPAPAHMFIGCGHVLRLSAVRQVGDYPPTPGTYGGEEIDLCLRLIDGGYGILKLPGVHVWHEKTSLARDLPLQYASVVCNDLALTLRRCPAPLFVPLLPGKLLSHLRFAARRGMLAPYLRGIGKFLRAIPEILLTRRPVSAAAFSTFRRLAREQSL